MSCSKDLTNRDAYAHFLTHKHTVWSKLERWRTCLPAHFQRKSSRHARDTDTHILREDGSEQGNAASVLSPLLGVPGNHGSGVSQCCSRRHANSGGSFLRGSDSLGDTWRMRTLSLSHTHTHTQANTHTHKQGAGEMQKEQREVRGWALPRWRVEIQAAMYTRARTCEHNQAAGHTWAQCNAFSRCVERQPFFYSLLLFWVRVLHSN